MTWIFLRGLGRSQKHWGDFPKKFQKKMNLREQDILHLDLAGNGTEANRKSYTQIADQVEDLRRRLKNHQPPFAIMSISLGSMVALEWAKKYPNEISRIILMNTSCNNLCYPHQRFQFLNPVVLKSVIKFLWQGSSHFNQETAVLKMTAQNLNSDLQDRLAKDFSHIQSTSIINLIRQIRMASKFVMPKNFATHIRLDFLVGEKDQLVNPECTKKMAQHCGHEAKVHLVAGHDLPLEDGDWILEQL